MMRKYNQNTLVRQYVDQYQLHAKDPKQWVHWGRKMLREGKNPFEIFYTPGIGKIILTSKKERDGLSLPSSLIPIVLEKSIFYPLFINNKKEFSKEILNKIYSYTKTRTLGGYGVVVTNRKRVLGFGEVPDGGEWITRGKCDCYEMATNGKVSTMLPLAIDVSGITSPTDHDNYVMEILKVLDDNKISLVQFEDFDGESAFRLLDRAKRTLACPVFNDDIEGTAWILWMGKLAGKAKSLIKSSRPKADPPLAEKILFDESENARKYGGILFRDSLFIFHGGGAASIGAANFFEYVLKKLYTTSGMTTKEALQRVKSQIIMTDGHGLLYDGRRSKSKTGQKEFKPFQKPWIYSNHQLLKKLNPFGKKISLLKTIRFFGKEILGPNGTIFLMGLSGHPEQFTSNIIRGARTVVDEKNSSADLFIDSATNPTHLTEILTKFQSQRFQKSSSQQQKMILADAIESVIKAANTKVVLTTGSPFHTGKYKIAQLNNLYGFPAMGMSVLSGKIKKITNREGEAVAIANVDYLLKNFSDKLIQGMICPPVESIFKVTRKAVRKLSTLGSQKV